MRHPVPPPRVRGARGLLGAVTAAALGLTALSALSVQPAAAAAPAPADTATTPATTPAAAAPHGTPVTSGTVTDSCAAPASPGMARCFARRVESTERQGPGLRSRAAAAPAGYAPADLLGAYDLPADGGTGATIAIVDAYDDPNAASDLAVYRAQFGLPALEPGQFRVVNQRGVQGDYPQGDTGWATETSLDLDMVSAIAPHADIILVEADTSGSDDLGASVDTAVALGATYVSNSYGISDALAGTSDDAFYDHPGVAIVASSGDDSYGVQFPASSPNVTSVGGTSLKRDAGTARGWSETVWDSKGGGPGSGCSTLHDKPSYQHDTGCDGRTVADVSAVADPYTGVAVYDTYGGQGSGWAQYGGTSVAAPIIAAAYALAGPIPAGDRPSSYPYEHTASLHDVTSGSNGTCTPAYLCTAGPGYDGPTGLGTPDSTLALSSDVPSSSVTGTVTDADGKPLTGVRVAASGPAGAASTTTGTDGTYRLPLPEGDYTLRAALFDYTAPEARQIHLAAGEITTADLTLTKVPTVTVSGRVTDGSGHGWPVYTALQIDNGVPGGPFYADPFTGRYSIELPEKGSYTLHALPQYAGYQPRDLTVTTGTKAVAQDIALDADLFASDGSALGYRQSLSGSTESFGAAALPAHWSTQKAAGPDWTFRADNNPTGGDGGYAVIPLQLQPTVADTSLVAAPLALTADETPVVSFDVSQSDGRLEVGWSDDGGATWTTAWSSNRPVTSHEEVRMPATGTARTLLVRFRFLLTTGGATATGGVSLDDVHVGGASLTVLPGALLTGTTTAGLTGDPLDGVAVAAGAAPHPVPGDPFTPGSVSAPLPGAAGLTDGFFYVFSPGTHPSRTVGGTLYPYDEGTLKVHAAADTVGRAHLVMPAGRVTATAEVDASAPWNGTATRTLTLTNSGDGPATVTLTPRTTSPAAAPAATAKGAAPQTVRVEPGDVLDYPAALARAHRDGKAPAAAAPAPAAPAAPGTPAADGTGWTGLTDLPSGFYSGVAANLGGTLYAGLGGNGPTTFFNTFSAYDAATGSWQRKADAPYPVAAAATATVDGKLYASGGAGIVDGRLAVVPATQVYDPATDSWSLTAGNPVSYGGAGASAGGKLYAVGGYDQSTFSTSADVAVYDPATDTWSRAADYPVAVETPQCGGIGGKVYCAGGTSAPVGGTSGKMLTDAYVYDPAKNSWHKIASLPIQLGSSAVAVANGQLLLSTGYTDNSTAMTNRGFAYDPAADRWTPLPNAATPRAQAAGATGFYSVGGASSSAVLADVTLLPGYGQEGKVAVPWLSTDRTSVTIPAGHHAKVTLRLDPRAAGLAEPSVHQAVLGLSAPTPEQIAPVTVRLTVRPPAGWGRVTGTITGKGGTPLPGATVVVTGHGGRHVLAADADGRYALWLDARGKPVTVTASAPGHRSASRTVRLPQGGGTVTADLELRTG
ncbi:carboxypeptidase regulatory-like domain-containing protein [Streptomyces sp. NPDC004031]